MKYLWFFFLLFLIPLVLGAEAPDGFDNVNTQYHLNENTGTSATNTGTNSTAGVITASSSWVSGVFGSAINTSDTDIQGVSDDADSYSVVAMWIKPYQNLVPGLSTQSFMWCQEDNDYTACSTNNFLDYLTGSFRCNSAGGGATYLANVSSGDLVHLICVKNSTGHFLYINGTQVASDSANPVGTDLSHFTVGGNWQSGGLADFDGLIDEFHLFTGGYINQSTIDTLSSGSLTLITNTSWNVTSGNTIDGNTTAWNDGGVVTVSSNLLSFTVQTNLNTNMSCRLNIDQNYTTMVAANASFKSATTETTEHAMTLPEDLSVGSDCVYCAFVDATNTSNQARSGCLQLTFQDQDPPVFGTATANQTQVNREDTLRLTINVTDDSNVTNITLSVYNPFSLVWVNSSSSVSSMSLHHVVNYTIPFNSRWFNYTWYAEDQGGLINQSALFSLPFNASLTTEGTFTNKTYELGTPINISCAGVVDVYDSSEEYLARDCPLVYPTRTVVFNINDSPYLNSTNNYTVKIFDNRTDLENFTLLLRGDNVANLSLAVINQTFSFPGNLRGTAYEQQESILNDINNVIHNISFNTSSTRTLFVNYSKFSDVNYFNFTITAFDLDINNEFNFTENFTDWNKSLPDNVTFQENITAERAVVESFATNETGYITVEGSTSDTSYSVGLFNDLFRTQSSSLVVADPPLGPKYTYENPMIDFRKVNRVSYSTRLVVSGSVGTGVLCEPYYREKVTDKINDTDDETIYTRFSSTGSNGKVNVDETRQVEITRTGSTTFQYKYNSTPGVFTTSSFDLSGLDNSQPWYLLEENLVDNTGAGSVVLSCSQTVDWDWIDAAGIVLNKTYDTGTNFSTKGRFESTILTNTTDPIIQAILSWDHYTPSSGQVTAYMSNDNGTNWDEVTNGVRTSFSGSGTLPKIRFNLSSTNASYSPIVYDYSFNIIPSSVTSLDIVIANQTTTYDYELNASSTPVFFNNTHHGVRRYINSTCTNSTCLIPISFTTGSGGTLQISNLNLTSTLLPIQINVTPLEQEQQFNIIPSFSAGTNFRLYDFLFRYLGNKNVSIKAYDSFGLNNFTLNASIIYSKWNFSFNGNAEYLEFIPRTATQKNVTPYTQTVLRGIFNITTQNYHNVPMNWSMYVNDSFSCVNLTVSKDSDKNNGTLLINDTWTDIFTNKTNGYETGIWMWADYSCNFSNFRLWNPLLSMRGCAVGSVCSEDNV